MTKRQFNFFPNGGPYPGTCVACRSNVNLFDLGADLLSGGNAMICKQCVTDLAVFMDYTEEAPLRAEIAALKADIVSRETELAAVPKHIEELINGIRSNVTNFVLTVSGSSDDSSSVPIQEPAVSNAGASKPRKTASRNP